MDPEIIGDLMKEFPAIELDALHWFSQTTSIYILHNTNSHNLRS